MLRTTISASLLLVTLVFSTVSQAQRVDNFVLLDQNGEAQNLYYHQDAKAVVIMVQGNGCPIVRNAINDYKQVRDEFEASGVKFFMLNSNLQDSRSAIAAEAKK